MWWIFGAGNGRHEIDSSGGGCTAGFAIGLVSAAASGLPCGDPNFRSYFQPIGPALDALGLQLMTV